jgi:hypothetical protein
MFVKGDGIEPANLGTVLRALGLNPTQATVEQYAKNFEGTFKCLFALSVLDGLPAFWETICVLTFLWWIGERSISFEKFLPVYQQIQAKKEEGSKEDFIEGELRRPLSLNPRGVFFGGVRMERVVRLTVGGRSACVRQGRLGPHHACWCDVLDAFCMHALFCALFSCAAI